VTRSTNNGIYTIVLAAGTASRFGSSKQLAELDGIALVRRATQIAKESCGSRSVLVAGHDWHAVFGACDRSPGFLIVNDQHEKGIGSSISLAVRSIRHVARAIVILLADQPLITSAHIAALIDGWSGDNSEIVATAYAGTLGAPALFPMDCFGDLAAMAADNGAQALFNDKRFLVQSVRFEDAAVDIDTKEDLSSLQRSVHS
jgi:CTP:molybdopterin cytidylyltransferase MocA